MAKENKFTRSVLERLEQEQQKQKEEQKITSKKIEPVSMKDANSVAEETAPVKEEIVEAPASEKIKTSVEPEKTVPDLSQFLSKKDERVAKNKTFYLDEEVIDALRRAAKSQKMTDSRLVNEILRGVLGII